MYICVYIYICVCVCVYVYIYIIEITISCIRTLQWRGNWINRHENKIEMKKILILILNFEFNLIKVLLYPYVKLLHKVILN